MLRKHVFVASLILLTVGPAPALYSQSGPGTPPSPTVAFSELDSPRKEVTNFNIETTRGMVWAPDHSRLYAINTHGSRLLYHTGPDGPIDGQWTTINNPVALDIWDRDTLGYDLIVAGGSTHAVVRHDSESGAILDMLNLPSEPGDLVVTPDGHAWVSCQGANVVVEIDLATFTIIREFDIPSQRPRFLSWHEPEPGIGGEDEHESPVYRVFVAPMVSGNNTTRQKNGNKVSTVQALPEDDPATPGVLEGLPDEDLFELIPGSGDVHPVVKGLGTLILEHAFHPTSDEMWVLSIVSKNADEDRQSEPSLESDFAESALTLLSLPDQGALPIRSPGHIDLDDTTPDGGMKTYSSDTSCSFPFAVAFDPCSGSAFVAGSTSDRILQLDASGSRVAQRDLPDGSIPRDILIDADTGLVMVYLWGINEIHGFPISDISAAPIILELGNDPTPSAIAAGRRHWYDADNSLHGRNTCNICHPGGGSDFLGWSLGDPPLDRKDVMVTQSLLGIEDSFPYHWRGERQLRDFNRLAFSGLLGGDALRTPSSTNPDETEFETFKEFVFSLQPPRNPNESWDRAVTGLKAIDGKNLFENKAGFFGFTCLECHGTPSGSQAIITADNPSEIGSNSNFDVAHLRQLFNKENPLVTTTSNPNGIPRLGYGLNHDGAFANLFEFLRPLVFRIDTFERENIAAFVSQWDQGTAPAAQLGWLLDQAGASESKASILQYLIPQSAASWLDVVAFGTIQDSSGQTVFARWLYDPSADEFNANDRTLTLAGGSAGRATLSDFVSQARAGTASNTFLGLPPGNGRRFALDPDNDRLNDDLELALLPTASDPENPDSDGDGDPDGHEYDEGGDPLDSAVQALDSTPPGLEAGYPRLIDVTAQTAKYELRFTEPVTYSISYNRPGEAALTRRRVHPVVEDTITLQEMRPSSQDSPGFPASASTYSLVIDLTDLGGNSSSISIGSMPTLESHLEVGLQPDNRFSVFGRRIGALSMTATRTGNTLDATVSVNVEMMHETANDLPAGGLQPRANQRVVAQLLRKTTGGWEVVPESEILGPVFDEYWSSATASESPAIGPLMNVLISDLTDAAGDVSVEFSLSGLSAGDEVRYNIVGIYENPSWTTDPSHFFLNSLFSWQLANTEDDPGNDRRGVTVIF